MHTNLLLKEEEELLLPQQPFLCSCMETHQEGLAAVQTSAPGTSLKPPHCTAALLTAQPARKYSKAGARLPLPQGNLFFFLRLRPHIVPGENQVGQ